MSFDDVACVFVAVVSVGDEADGDFTWEVSEQAFDHFFDVHLEKGKTAEHTAGVVP